MEKHFIDKKHIYVVRTRLILIFFLLQFFISVFFDILSIDWIFLSSVLIVAFIFFYAWYYPQKYKNLLYFFDNRNIYISYGVFYLKTSSMDIQSIQYTSVVQTPIQRLCKIQSLILYSSSSKIHIPSLHVDQINEIEKIVGYEII